MTLRERLGRRWSDDQRFRFLVVGAYNTAFGYLVFPLLYLLLSKRMHYALILVIAHQIAVTQAFVLHRRFAFRAEGAAWLPQFLRFNVGYLGALGVGLGGMYLFVSRLHVSPLVAQPALTTLTIVLSYLWHSRVSFRASSL